MQTKFTPSINIERDINKELVYIPTANSKSIFNQFQSGFQSGIHSFNIIGSYGTGKSSFLWALEKNLKDKVEYFAPINGQFNGIRKFEFINIVGQYSSLNNILEAKLAIKNGTAIDKLEIYYNSLLEQNTFLIIVIDEFGKFLEYSAEHNPEKELYFIQQLAEFVNDTDKNIILLTTLHQNFNSYSYNLSRIQQYEWEKVKGRFKELAFNEPVEQLLFLAAEHIGAKSINTDRRAFREIFNLIKPTQIISFSDSINEELAEKLAPLDVLSAMVLTLALQKYGQNERSLFTFLEAKDEFGISSFISGNTNSTYNLAQVFDYLIHTFYSTLNTSRTNEDLDKWSSIRQSIDRTERIWDKQLSDAIKLVKTIGLLNIFSSHKSYVNKDFLSKYAQVCLNIKNAISIIDDLERKQIIRFANYRSQYVLFLGTDLDINHEIAKAEEYVSKETNIISKLNEYVDFPYVPAKATHYKVGTPRFFQFKLSQEPITLTPEGEIDGFINLIFSTSVSEADIKSISATQNEAIIYALFKKTKKIRDVLFEIDKINHVLKNVDTNDRVAVNELKRQLDFERQRVNEYLTDNLFKISHITWIYNGNQIAIPNQTHFNKLLSEICNDIYPSTPVLRNELLNKQRISSAISTARKKFIEALINNLQQDNLGIEKFPPEKAIYLSLLKSTGIHKHEEGRYKLSKPNADSDFYKLWEVCEDFLVIAKQQKKELTELVKILSQKPFKLKQGLIDFWLPIFLIAKKEDFALFYKDVYIPYISPETANLIYRSTKDFSIKTFDVEGVKLELFNEYRRLIELETEDKATQKGLIETIKPFLVFYKQLPEYTQNTKKLAKHPRQLRDAIAKAKEPSKTFFDDFPLALGFKDLNLRQEDGFLSEYLNYFEEAIRQIRTCFSDLIDRVEKQLLTSFGIPETEYTAYKKIITQRYKGLKINLLPRKQKIFFNALISPIDIRNAWLNAIVQAVMDKKLELLKDEEESLLMERLAFAVQELDNLVPIHKAKSTKSKDEIIKFDITTVKGTKTKQLVISENKKKSVEGLSKKIIDLLQGESDTSIQQAAIIKILQERLNK